MFLRLALIFGLWLALVDATHKCGTRNVDGVGFRISAEEAGVALYGEFPWMVAIMTKVQHRGSEFNLYSCGGSLIHPSVVLTAASCVQNKTAAETLVRLGEWDTQTRDELLAHQDRQVKEIVAHSGFAKSQWGNNVALLFLVEPAELTDTVGTVCLPPVGHSVGVPRCFASGWGKDGPTGRYQVILKKLELPIVSHDKCQEVQRTKPWAAKFVPHSNLICAGGEQGPNMCEGDIGSPLVCHIPGTINRYYQVGLVTDEFSCGKDETPVLFVNVALLREWIEGQLKSRKMQSTFFNHS